MLWNRIDLSLLAMLVRERGVRILHLHWQHPYLGGTGALARISKPIVFLAQIALIKLLGVRIVWTVHNLKDHESANERLEGVLLQGAGTYGRRLIADRDCAKQETAGGSGSVAREGARGSTWELHGLLPEYGLA